MTHFIGKVTQKALIVRDGMVLLNRDVGSDTYDLPGGRLDEGEDPATGLKREIQEELRIDIAVGLPVYTCQTLWGTEKSPHFFVAYAATLVSDAAEITADGVEVEEARWINPEEIATIKLHSECATCIRAFFALSRE